MEQKHVSLKLRQLEDGGISLILSVKRRNKMALNLM